MKYLFFLLLAFPTLAQQFKVDTLIHNGPVDNRVNVVILGDGFSEAELPDFIKAAQSFTRAFSAEEPFRQYQRYFNFYAISTPSPESGISNPGTAPDAYPNHPVATVNNFFGGTFGTGIHRLTGVTKAYLIYDVLSNNFPEYDIIVIILNTPFYGGSGGVFATFTLHPQANDIGIHEIGHSFSKLSDEYWAGAVYARENINMTKETRHEHVRWKHWLDTPPTGIFPHGASGELAQWMKPANGNCMMEYLHQPFCPVCREATVERILAAVNPVGPTSPPVDKVISVLDPTMFSLDLLHPEPSTLRVLWDLDGTELQGDHQVTLRPEDIRRSVSTLTAIVVDETPLSRQNPVLRTRNISWKLTGKDFIAPSIAADKTELCSGESAVLTFDGCTGSISWSNGQTASSITVAPQTTTRYSATCTLAEGVITTAEIFLNVYPRPELLVSNTGPYYEKDIIALKAEGAQHYRWTGPLGFQSDLQNPTIPNARTEHSGIYRLTAWNTAPCVSEATTEVKVEMILATEDAFVRVYPNPVQDEVKIDVPFSGTTTAVLYTVEGKVMKHKAFENSTSLPVKDLPAGHYFIKLQNGKSERVLKITLL